MRCFSEQNYDSTIFDSRSVSGVLILPTLSIVFCPRDDVRVSFPRSLLVELSNVMLGMSGSILHVLRLLASCAVCEVERREHDDSIDSNDEANDGRSLAGTYVCIPVPWILYVRVPTYALCVVRLRREVIPTSRTLLLGSTQVLLDA